MWPSCSALHGWPMLPLQASPVAMSATITLPAPAAIVVRAGGVRRRERDAVGPAAHLHQVVLAGLEVTPSTAVATKCPVPVALAYCTDQPSSVDRRRRRG